MSTTDDVPPGARGTSDRGTDPGGRAEAVADDAYQRMERDPDFVALRRRWRSFVFPMSAVFLIWFLLYVLLSAFAPGLVNTTLGDSNITVGLLLGLLQFVSTFVIATVYARFADRALDPEATRLRARVEADL